MAADRLKRNSWLSIAKPKSSEEKDKQIRDLIARVRELKAIDSGQLSTIRDSQSRVDMIGNLTTLVNQHKKSAVGVTERIKKADKKKPYSENNSSEKSSGQTRSV